MSGRNWNPGQKVPSSMKTRTSCRSTGSGSWEPASSRSRTWPSAGSPNSSRIASQSSDGMGDRYGSAGIGDSVQQPLGGGRFTVQQEGPQCRVGGELDLYAPEFDVNDVPDADRCA